MYREAGDISPAFLLLYMSERYFLLILKSFSNKMLLAWFMKIGC
jgi:hypothetical protein